MFRKLPLPVRVLSAAALLSASGCASWNSENWDMSRYRDPRATDIDDRLTDRPVPVASPFGMAEEVR